jgi:hypothetical protein
MGLEEKTFDHSKEFISPRHTMTIKDHGGRVLPNYVGASSIGQYIKEKGGTFYSSNSEYRGIMKAILPFNGVEYTLDIHAENFKPLTAEASDSYDLPTALTIVKKERKTLMCDERLTIRWNGESPELPEELVKEVRKYGFR